ARISDRTAFFLNGYLMEVAPTPVLFQTPQRKETEDYITGRFG
ncbi:MAG: phosphate ABC transporter ATP-binding protein, partial [Candidatus Carbobacillus sp.]|nr:phosphate ABC transporter ATP-binding protein [Candidatus Carbobacillus sp.]